MYKSYYCEPTPLRVEYFEGTTRTEAFMMGMGMFLALLLVCALPEFPRYPGPLWQAYSVALVLFLLCGLLFWAALPVGKWLQQRAWQRAFLTNNADLALDLRAVGKVITHMKQKTGYCCISLREVCVNLAPALRDQNVRHSTFSFEVHESYRFFTGKRSDLPETSLPKS